MKHLKTRTAGLVLAFGIFFSSACSQLEMTEENVENVSSGDQIEREIDRINKLISENPENDSLNVRKAQLLLTKAETTDNPEDREPYYASMRDLHLDYQYTGKEVPSQLETLRVRAWNQENRSALRQLQENTENLQPAQYERAVAHFENAISVLPDSTSTIFLLSTTHYKMGNLTSAIETLEKSSELNEENELKLNEKLAFLYLESGDIDEAIRRYEDLVSTDSDNDHYRHGLVNALIIKRDHDGAIRQLEELKNQYPNRISYRESLAAEYYFRFEQNAGNTTDLRTEGTIEALLDDLQKADSLYQELKTVLPANEENLYTMASFYSNAALSLDDLQNEFGLQNESGLEELKNRFFNNALPFWEQLAELSPDNTEFLIQLYQVYVALNMSDRANALEQSLNLNTDL